MEPRGSEARRGIAMVAVVLVLMALFVLSAPFLLTVRNADRASSEAADRSLLRVTLDSAARHAAAGLSASHPALDPTPYFDDQAELEVSSAFDAEFLRTADPEAAMWDLDARDVAARVDLASASPHVLANLIGGSARLTALCKDKDAELQVSATQGFLPEGVVLVDGELIGYAELAPARLGKLTRGLLVKSDADGNPLPCGPTAPAGHDVGAFVLDQRAWALCEWRIASGEFREYDGIERVREARDFVLAPELGREAYLALERAATTFGRVRAGARWQRPARVVGDVGGEPQYGCKLPLDDLRWFNAGATVCITDGKNTEYALVRAAEDGALTLTEPLRHPFEALKTVVSPLARAPVNVNTATPEVLRALWTNLKLRGRTARITGGEAAELVELVLASRPFTGFEDFLRRALLPAAGLDELPEDAPVKPEKLEELARAAKPDAQGKKQLAGFIDPDDAVALYKNALNANDNELEFATMPLCFTSRDVYDLDLRAVVNAPSGIERATGVRELTEVIVPQRDLLSIWTRQEDFDEAPRLDLAAAGWLTGPLPTSRYDPRYGEVASIRWPTRARAHLGPHDTSPSVDPLAEEEQQVYCFATREDEDGWAQLAPAHEEDKARKATYALHFDDESKTLEGRFLPDGAAELDLAKLGWSAGGLMSGMAHSLWVQPRALEEGARLLDVGGQFRDSDRLSLLFEGGDLVLRVLDGAGDHPSSDFVEQAEVRYPLAGEGPGLPLDTWSHVQIAVDGTRPDQMALWVDGRRSKKTPGLTRLTQAISGESDTIPVESTEGFPEKCVLRIGNELVEAIKKGDTAFQAKFQSTGENAGFGGRLARETFEGAEGSEINHGLYKDIDHPAGSTVQLYGYSLPLALNVPTAGSALAASLGPFGVARAVGIVKGGEQTEEQMEVIESTLSSGSPLELGWGLDSQGRDVQGLVLESADPNVDITQVMQTFSPNGGYAALLSVRWTLHVIEGLTGSLTEVTTDKYGVRLGGVEVIRYSGVDGTHLLIDKRGDEVALPNLSGSGASPDVAGRGAFIFEYDDPFVPTTRERSDWYYHNEELSNQVMVIPISIPAGSTGGITGFPQPQAGRSEFVQITRTGGEAHLTEWVRYDDLSTDGHLVRDDSAALLEANAAAHARTDYIDSNDGKTNPPEEGGGGGSGDGGRGGSRFLEPSAGPARTFRAPSARQSGQAGQSTWYYAMGEAEDDELLVTRSVRSHLQFRGVLGTFSHPQPAGAAVLPAIKLQSSDETTGWPGRFDHATLFLDEPDQPGFPVVVYHAHRPLEYTDYFWQDGGELTPAESVAPVGVPQHNMDLGVIYVALERPVPIFIPASPIDDPQNPTDSRRMARMSLFPSGELPRMVQRGQLGGDVFARRGAVPSAVVDEALFFPNVSLNLGGMPTQLILARALGEADPTFTAAKDFVRTTRGDVALQTNVLASLPEHGGLLRIGDELLCYDSHDATTFIFTLPPGARGLCGTPAQPHRGGEGITFVGSLPAAVLAANIGPDDALVPLLEIPPGMPSQGTVWIDGELVHYTRAESGILEMPRASSEPGEMDRKGPGLFRGRYGTQRSGHTRGAPVILFPFRYWDRWTELADAPEMSWYQLALDQPDALWKRVFWKVSEAGFAGPALGVLERTNPETPWDAPPEGDNGLRLLWEGKLDGGGNPLGVQSDRVEWRVFVRHLPGSFDPDQGLAHGWKTTPRLELFGAEYMGPGRTLARIDR